MSLPFHQSEKNFRRYEPAIKQIIANFPAPTRFKPENFSVQTVSARLRDAIRYYLHPDCKWESSIDKEQLKHVMSGFVISFENEIVTVRPPTSKATALELAPTTTGNSILVDHPSLKELCAFGLLLGNQRMAQEVHFTNIDRSVLSEFEQMIVDDPRLTFFQQGTEWILL